MAKTQLAPEQLINFLSVLPSHMRRKVFNDILSQPISMELNVLPIEAHEPVELDYEQYYDAAIPTLTNIVEVAA